MVVGKGMGLKDRLDVVGVQSKTFAIGTTEYPGCVPAARL